MRITRKQRFFEADHLEFFENGSSSPLGQLKAAGTGRRGTLGRWYKPHQMKVQSGYSLVLLLPGGAGFYSDANGFECRVAYGDFILQLPHLKHQYAPGQEEYWDEICVSFKGTSFDTLREAGVLDERRPVWHLETPENWIARFRRILGESRPVTLLDATLQTAQFLAFLLELLKVATPKSQQAPQHDWFATACVLLTNDMHQKIDPAQIAHELDMSYHTFRALFAQRAGIAPMKFRDRRRQGLACERLVETGEPCWVIARHLGFCNEHHFSNRFKQWTGLTPSQYREKYRGEKA